MDFSLEIWGRGCGAFGQYGHQHVMACKSHSSAAARTACSLPSRAWTSVCRGCILLYILQPLIRLMDKILHDLKDPKLWELWYIPYNG